MYEYATNSIKFKDLQLLQVMVMAERCCSITPLLGKTRHFTRHPPHSPKALPASRPSP